jgi:nucleotide-binding universal stress UspA family protein
MKNILVPTDFSKNATDAAHYAAVLAQTTGARLLLFHAYQVSIAMADAAALSIDLDLENFENLNQTRIDSLAYDLHKGYGISVTRIMRPGFATDEIPGIAQRLKADIIVMGMRGTGNLTETVLGSTTTTLLRITEEPVLCIPEGYSFEAFAHIKFILNPLPTGGHPDKAALDKLISLLQSPATCAGHDQKLAQPVLATTRHLADYAAAEIYRPPVLTSTFQEFKTLAVMAAGEQADAATTQFEKTYNLSGKASLIPLLAIPPAEM